MKRVNCHRALPPLAVMHAPQSGLAVLMDEPESALPSMPNPSNKIWDHCCERECHRFFALYCMSTRANIKTTLVVLSPLYLNNDIAQKAFSRQWRWKAILTAHRFVFSSLGFYLIINAGRVQIIGWCLPHANSCWEQRSAFL